MQGPKAVDVLQPLCTDVDFSTFYFGNFTQAGLVVLPGYCPIGYFHHNVAVIFGPGSARGMSRICAGRWVSDPSLTATQ